MRRAYQHIRIWFCATFVLAVLAFGFSSISFESGRFTNQQLGAMLATDFVISGILVGFIIYKFSKDDSSHETMNNDEGEGCE